MNPVLILTHNCLELTKKCVASVRAQNIPTFVAIFDNGSTDGTIEWCRQQSDDDFAFWPQGANAGVSFGWNKALGIFFDNPSVDYVLTLNNDTILPPWFYKCLLDYSAPFVTGTSVGSMDAITAPEPVKTLVEAPDFSAFLIRREAWEKIGKFDESMKHYASDVDYHIRAQRLGINLWNSGVNFYHERSATLRLSNPAERRKIEMQADLDRAAFKLKYGFGVDDPRCQTGGI